MNGNCSNPKCAFRHPPLDGLFGIPGTPTGPLPTSLQAVAHASGTYNPNKQSVPCYYFQKGQCLKGDRCQFMHGPQPAGIHATEQATNGSQSAVNSDPLQSTNGPLPNANYATERAVNAPTSFSGTSQRVPWGLKECGNTAHQTIQKIAADKQVEAPYPSANFANKGEGIVKGVPFMRSPSPYQLRYEPPRSEPTAAPVSSGNSPSRPQHQPQPTEEHYSNGRETDDFLGESSPGFDVLVDDDEDYGRDPDCYHNEDEFGRNPNHSVNEFDYPRLDYEAVANFEREQYNEQGEYDQYGRAHGQHERGRHSASTERPLDRIPKRRPDRRDSSPDEVDGSDLRHRLRKQRRLNDLRSAVSPDRHDEPRRRDDRHSEDRYRGRHSGRDRDRRTVPQEGSLSSRLRGRLALPVRSPPHRPIESRLERDRDREWSRGRLSPARPISYKGRPHDRIRRSPDEEFTAGRRSFGVKSNKRDDRDPSNFAAPKSLAELKGAKASARSQDQPTKGLSAPLTSGFQAAEDLVSFEGPKPLSEILKRKKDSALSSGEESIERNAEGFIDSASDAADAATVKGDCDVSDAEKLEIQTAEEEEDDALVTKEEDGATVEVAEEQGQEGDYDEEAIEGEDMYQDDENAYQDDENAYQEDEDDEDEFAKKVGVFFS